MATRKVLLYVAIVGFFLLEKGFAEENKMQKHLYPYVVPKTAFPNAPESVTRFLGNDIIEILVFEINGKIRPVDTNDLKQMNLTFDEAEKIAVDHLAEKAELGEIRMKGFDQGPHGKKFLLFGGHWLAATCILLPDLSSDRTKKTLGTTDEICASIPHSEAMLLFQKGDVQYRKAMMEMIREKEAWGERRLTEKLFTVSGKSIKPLE